MTVSNKVLVRREEGYDVWSETSLLGFEAKVVNDAGDAEEPYTLVESINNAQGEEITIESCYTPNGDYIGNEKDAMYLTTKGIQPELRKGTSVCSIGFCEREQQWYGWSHRAIYGFGVGSEVKRGSCAYMPIDEEDFRQDMIRFWTEDQHENVQGFLVQRDGKQGVNITWTYSQTIVNESLRGTECEVFHTFPETWGRGEWTAKTLEDAKQMAEDFAEGVS